MRRLFRDTTAIAVCLTVALPHVVVAEPVVGAADLRLAQAEPPVIVLPGQPGARQPAPAADPAQDETDAAAARAARAAAEKANSEQGRANRDDKGDEGKGNAKSRQDEGKGKAEDDAKEAKSEEKRARDEAKAAREAAKAAEADARTREKDAEATIRAREKAAEADARAQEKAAEKAARQQEKAERAARKAESDARADDAARAARKAAADDAENAATRAAQATADEPADANVDDLRKALSEEGGDDRAAARAAEGAGAAPVVVPGERARPAERAQADPPASEAPVVVPSGRARAERAPQDPADDRAVGDAPIVVPQGAGQAGAQPRPGDEDLADAPSADAPVVVGGSRGEDGPVAGAPSDADIAKALAERQGQAVVTPVPGDDGAGTPVVIAPQADPGKGPDDLAAAVAGSVPEAAAKETAAAREAAQEATTPSAAALAESSQPVVETQATEVTEENSRQATEDFATDLRGNGKGDSQIPVVVGGAPVQGRQPQDNGAPVVVGGTGDGQQAREDDDDLADDLARIAIPALAGLIAGRMLSNDRQVELNTGDRVIVTRPDGSQEIIKDDNALLLRPGSTVQTEEFADGSTRTTVTREDGSQVVTIRDRDLRVLRRTLVAADGTATQLIDETAEVQPVVVSELPPPARPVVLSPDRALNESELREALRQETAVNRTFTLGQIRNIPEVRALVAPVDIQAITFDTGSAAIKPDQAQQLASLGRVIVEAVRENPREMFLIEGHTDAVGSAASNLALSDRRAESVALALTEFFDVPPENMVVQGYGEQFLRVATEGDERANRRAAVRRITQLLARN